MDAHVSAASCKLMPARMSQFLDAETCEFSQVPSLSMGVHGTLRYLNLTFILINILRQASLGNKQTICQVLILRDTHSGYYRRSSPSNSRKSIVCKKSIVYTRPSPLLLSSFSCHLQVNAARVSHFLDAETGEFSTSSIAVHERPLYIKGPFKCYVTLFSWKFDPHPPPRNANNVGSYTGSS